MDELTRLRARIDRLDQEIADRIAQRFEVVRMVGSFKRDESIPMLASDRVHHVREHYRRRGQQQGTPGAFTDAFVNLLLGATCSLEDDIIGQPPDVAEAR